MKNNKGFVGIIVLAVAGFFTIVGLTSYVTYYSIKSEAKIFGTNCITNRACSSNLQCGTTGKCDFSTVEDNPNMPQTTRAIGRCSCIKPSPKPTSSIAVKTEKWWYDSGKKGIIECKREEINSDRGQNIKSFATLKACELDIFNNRPDVAKLRCKQRNGIELSIVNVTPGAKQGYSWSFNIDKMTACWTPQLSCALCNSRCTNLNVNKCQGPNNNQTGTTPGPTNINTNRNLPVTSSQCTDVLGRCAENGLSIPKPTPVCSKPGPAPTGCRYVIQKTTSALPEKCPQFKIICTQNISVTKIPYPTRCPKPDAPEGCRIVTKQTVGILPTDCPSFEVVCNQKMTKTPTPVVTGGASPTPAISAQQFCINSGGKWNIFTTDTGNQGWCLKGYRGCEGEALLDKTCAIM